MPRKSKYRSASARRRAKRDSRSYSPSRRYDPDRLSRSGSPYSSEDDDIVTIDPSQLDVANSATVKKLYEGPLDKDKCRTWLDKPTDELAEAAERKAQCNAYAVVLRYMKSIDESGEKVYVLGSLVLQNDLLKTAVRTVLEEYPNAGTHSKKPTFNPPFEPFYHCWNKFKQYMADKHDTEASPHLELLHGILDAELSLVRGEVESLTKHGVITYNTLWTLYPPGSVVFGRMHGQDHVFTVKRTSVREADEYSPPALDIVVNYLHSNGVEYGYGKRTFMIRRFDGERKITELDLVPQQYHPEAEKVMQTLLERAQKYTTLAFKQGHKAYKGMMRPADFGARQFVSDISGSLAVRPF